MPARIPSRRPVSLFLVMGLVAVVIVIVVLGFLSDRETRARGPESPVIAYASAVERSDLQQALDQLAPNIRQRSTSFVQWQLGNRYTILDSAVRGQPLLDRILNRPAGQTEVVVTVKIKESNGTTWQTTEGWPVAFIDGRWFLQRPPLQPAS